jgi:acyl-coenzyme A thioesterase PaaI-like protein
VTSHEDLIEELRCLIAAFRLTDFNERIDDGYPLDDIVEELRKIREQLHPYSVSAERMQAGLRPQEYFFRPDKSKRYDLKGLEPHEFFPYSPIIGPLNPISPPFTFRIENEMILGHGNFDSQYCGPPESVHGGYVAALMDELLGVTCVVSGHGGYTGTLSVRYISPTPLDKELNAKAWVQEIEDRKAVIVGELRDGNQLCAEAEGVFIRPKDQFLIKE